MEAFFTQLFCVSFSKRDRFAPPSFFSYSVRVCGGGGAIDHIFKSNISLILLFHFSRSSNLFISALSHVTLVVRDQL